ncbi:DNA primase, partial [human gut metagenome]
KVEQKHYYGIAFGNLSEGHEVRNPYFKGCIGHKDITLLAHTFNEWQNGCLVFEGFMDFLAYMTLVKQQDRWFVVESPCDYMILNSVANLKQALHYLDRYTHIHCFLDNDQAGRKTVESISNVFEYRVTDESAKAEAAQGQSVHQGGEGAEGDHKLPDTGSLKKRLRLIAYIA